MTEDTERMLHESPEYRQEQLSAALDGMLTPDEQAALDAHLAGCEACSHELEALRQVRSLLRAVPQPALPRSFLLPTEGDLVAPRDSSRVVEHQPVANVTPLRQQPRRAARTLQVTRWIGTIAAVLGLALFLGSFLTHQGAMNSATTSAPQYGAAAPAGRTATGETNPTPTHSHVNSGGPSTDKAATATSSPTLPTMSAATPTPQAYASPSPSFGDILRTVALVLLFGGIVLALASVIVARLI